jgi:hypothetical protein
MVVVVVPITLLEMLVIRFMVEAVVRITHQLVLRYLGGKVATHQ